MKKENLFSFMRQVTAELQGRGNLGTAHVYKRAQSEKSVHANLYKLLTLRHENLPCILDVPSRWA